ncbi:MAG: ABC transporter substrate-binding protein [Clostridiales bacterium]|jgi:NitT/TauT family transport system substrate-binding protein|nr:ABC transporter substrate-binding protein [Clostridiales bacterium]
MKKIFGVTLLLALLFSGCNRSGNEVLTEISVAYFPNITHAQALVMKGEGLLEEKLGGEITVKWIAFNAGPSEIEALFAGEIDIGYIGPVPAINGYVQSQGDLRIIAGASNGGSVLVSRNDAAINSAADLDGKTVGVPQFGNTQHLSLLSLLSANGLSPAANGGTVNVVQSSNADIANLMDQKNIDAALVPEPWGSILEIEHGAQVVLDYDEVDVNGIPSTAVVIVSKDFLDNHRDIVNKFMEAHKEATLFINANDVRDVINAQISAITQSTIDLGILESALKRLEITCEIPAASIMDFARVGIAEQLITEMPADDLIDESFIK